MVGSSSDVLLATQECLIIWIVTLLSFTIEHAGYDLFFKWWPLMMFINIPFNTAQVILQTELRFDKILLINSIYSIGFFFVVLVNFLFLRMNLTELVLRNSGST